MPVRIAGRKVSENSWKRPVTTNATCSPMSTALSASRSIARDEDHVDSPLARLRVLADIAVAVGERRRHFVELVERDVERTKRLPFELGQFLVEGRPQVARDRVRRLRLGWSHPNRPVT